MLGLHVWTVDRNHPYGMLAVWLVFVRNAGMVCLYVRTFSLAWSSGCVETLGNQLLGYNSLAVSRLCVRPTLCVWMGFGHLLTGPFRRVDTCLGCDSDAGCWKIYHRSHTYDDFGLLRSVLYTCLGLEVQTNCVLLFASLGFGFVCSTRDVAGAHLAVNLCPWICLVL